MIFFDLFLLSLLLFLVSQIIVNRIGSNLLILIIAMELLFYSNNLLLLFATLELDDLNGVLFSFMILTVGAVESTIGFAVIVSFYKRRGDIILLERSYIKG